MHPVIVAYDGHANSDDALAFGAFAAALLDAPIEVVCAYPVGGRAAHAYDEVTRSAALDELAKARTRMPAGATATYKPLPATTLGHAIHDRAVEREARLVVVGASHHGSVHRALVGTLGTRLLHGAPCPVAVVPAGWSALGDGPTRIVAGYDTGPEAELALAAAEDLARRARLPLELVSVAPTGLAAAADWPMYPVPTDRNDDAVEVAREQLGRAAERIDAVIPVSITPLMGEAAGSLVGHVMPTDLLVLGSRGYGPVRSVLLGSVSQAVVADSTCPVLVVPRPAATGIERAQESTASVGSGA